MAQTAPKNQLVEQIEQVTGPVLAEQKAELVDLQFVHEHGSWVLRYFLDKEGGITLDDCATLSHRIGDALDAANIISQSYALEVSSPGLNRPLKKEKDFQKFVGERVDVSMFAPIEGQRHFKGTIQAAADGIVTVKDDQERLFKLPFGGIAKAKLDPDVNI